MQYRQNPLLFRNLGRKKFEHVPFGRPVVARGAAYADFDRDGDLDILISTNGGPAYFYRNDGGNANHYLRVKTAGTKSNRDGIGAVVRVKSASGTQWHMVCSGSSYCSQSELVLTFGLGPDTKVDSLEVRWPSGLRQTLSNLESNQFLLVEEGKESAAKISR